MYCVFVFFEGVHWKEGIQLQMHLKVNPPLLYTHTHTDTIIFPWKCYFDVKVPNTFCLKRQHTVLQTANVN